MAVDRELNWIKDPVVMIPAGSKEHYSIRSSSYLAQPDIDGFNNSVPLRVIGNFTYSPVGQRDFCYNYQPWKGQRPEGIRQFVPCDFDPRLNTRLIVGTAHLKLTASPVTLIHGKEPTEEAKPEEETKPESEENRDNPN
jgi:hypothetical protein